MTPDEIRGHLRARPGGFPFFAASFAGTGRLPVRGPEPFHFLFVRLDRAAIEQTDSRGFGENKDFLMPGVSSVEQCDL